MFIRMSNVTGVVHVVDHVRTITRPEGLRDDCY